MKSFKKFLLVIFCNILLITNLNSKEVPDSFADLVEKLIPSVVNISATRVVETRSQNPFPFQFPPGHPFEDLFKDFDRGGSPQKRKTQSLGSGFIIDKEGIIITNNHVIQSAEGINFSTKSANESGTSFEFKFVTNKILQNIINKNFLKLFIEIFLYKLLLQIL